MTVPVCLTIAGSDSGGGAGIQADLKAFAAAGVHGVTAITAITAQNTTSVVAVAPVDPAMIIAQINAVGDDFTIAAAKIGMLGSRPAIEAVDYALNDKNRTTPVVLDPVMIAESGGRLLDPDAEEALRRRLVPRVTVVTPNLDEARVLAQDRDGDAEQLARAIHALGPDVVIVTGGHRERAADLFFDGEQLVEIDGPRHPDGAAHGSGCTHSATLAARLALGDGPLSAARVARAVAADAVRDGLRGLGAGAGPVDVLGVRARSEPRVAPAVP
jgi:hydroxymethylpyrimidine/phosphomethylpyrimidine kinase